MLITFVIIAALVGMKINGVILAPWWFTVVACFFVLIVGMFISGFLKVRVYSEVDDEDF